MSQYEKHLFVCISGPYCRYDGDTEAISDRLKRQVADAGLRDHIRINRSGCPNHCGHGSVEEMVDPSADKSGSEL